MTRMTATEARVGLSDLLNRVAFGRERIILHRRGKDLAALVPIEDAQLLDRLKEQEEDRIDNDLAEQALAEMREAGEKPIPWNRAREVLRKVRRQTARRRKAA